MSSFKMYLIRIGLLTSVIILGSLFYLFDGFINKISYESLSNWLKVEEAAILEGNLLTSVTKNQRAVFSSEFLKGFVLADFSKEGQLEQISFGDRINLEKINSNALDDKIHVLRTGLFKTYAYAKIPSSDSKVIVFSFWSQELSKIFFITCLIFIFLFVLFGSLLFRIKQREEKKALEYAENAARVAHDIRSPLTRLSSFIDKFEQSDVKEELLSISSSISNITNDLIKNRSQGIVQPNPAEKQQSHVRLSSIKDEIDQVVLAKRQVYENYKFNLDLCDFELDLRLDTKELLRTLSNLIDNAIDASKPYSEIQIKSYIEGDNLKIAIKDFGKGIPKSILESVGTKGFTHGKENGSGLGVYYAQTALMLAGGELSLDSEENKGTEVLLTIPFIKTKAVTNKKVQIEKGSNVIFLDDDQSIIKAWKEYFYKNNLADDFNLHFFTDPNEFLKSNLDLKHAFLFSDYDLQTDKNGLDVISSTGMASRSLLVTGMSFDEKLRSRTSLMKIKVLDKANLNDIQVHTIVS